MNSMHRMALKMLMGDRGKYLSLVIGLAFSVFLITQQGSIFCGLMIRATGLLQNVGQPDLMVCDKNFRVIMELRPIGDEEIYRLRSVPGVAWAEPFFSGWADVTLPDGSYKKAHMLGLDRSTLVGQPPEVIEGALDDLRAPDAVFIEESGRGKLGNIKIGDQLRLNDQRATVAGFCHAKRGFESNVLIYTTYDNALRFVPSGRKTMSFGLVKAKPDHDVSRIASAINNLPGERLKAYTPEQMRWMTYVVVLREMGIGINFGITILLGFIVGTIVAAASLYQFTLDNLRYFAVLKAIGASSSTLVGMVLLQAITVGLIGYGIGVGLAGLFSLTGRRPSAELAIYFPWQLMAASLFAMILCVCLGSIISLKKVIRLEPAIVFK